jgi:hypothetical protein
MSERFHRLLRRLPEGRRAGWTMRRDAQGGREGNHNRYTYIHGERTFGSLQSSLGFGLRSNPKEL